MSKKIGNGCNSYKALRFGGTVDLWFGGGRTTGREEGLGLGHRTTNFHKRGRDFRQVGGAFKLLTSRWSWIWSSGYHGNVGH